MSLLAIIAALVAFAGIVWYFTSKRGTPSTDAPLWKPVEIVPWPVEHIATAKATVSSPLVTVTWSKPINSLVVGDVVTAIVYLNGVPAPIPTTCQWAMDAQGIVQVAQSTTTPGLNRLTALKAGAVRLIALAGGGYSSIMSATVSALVPPPASHEPSGFAKLNAWTGASLGAWLTSDGKLPRQTFIVGADGVPRMVEHYGPTVVPVGFTYGPGHLYYPIPNASRPLTKLYVRARIRLSANWQQNPAWDTKIFQVWTGNGPAWHAYTVGTVLYGKPNDLRFLAYSNVDPVYGPGVPLGQQVLRFKHVPLAPDVFTLNVEHTIEFVVELNTPGVSNGKLRTWLDSKLQTSLDDVMWTPIGAAGINDFRQFDLNPLWGGQGGTLAQEQQMLIGEVYVSAAS